MAKGYEVGLGGQKAGRKKPGDQKKATGSKKMRDGAGPRRRGEAIVPRGRLRVASTRPRRGPAQAPRASTSRAAWR